jgi:hypothetical protein
LWDEGARTFTGYKSMRWKRMATTERPEIVAFVVLQVLSSAIRARPVSAIGSYDGAIAAVVTRGLERAIVSRNVRQAN